MATREMKIPTKEYPEGDEVVINKFKVTYSQESELTDDDNELSLSIDHQGAGFYYVLKTERWTFDNIEDLIKILEDFKSKANVI